MSSGFLLLLKLCEARCRNLIKKLTKSNSCHFEDFVATAHMIASLCGSPPFSLIKCKSELINLL